ncbi:MAG: aspartyl protease family protein [Sphingomonadaceae bacterium]
MSEIRGRHDGGRLLVPARVLAPHPAADLTGVSGQALIDTGSTVTGISPGIIRRLGLVGRGKRPLGSVHGEGQAERYLFRVGIEATDMSDPAFPFIFEEVIGFELRDISSFDILLGMDILRRCDLEMRRNGSFRLAFG